MDNAKTTPAKEAKAAKAPESVYTAEELVKAHKAFDVSHEIAAVALRLEKVESATFAEAKKIIDKFKNKEV